MKYLIITGASRGIGKKTIEYFMQQGWQAINLSRTPCDLPNVTNLTTDLNSLESIPMHATTLRGILKNAETICLVHNAGYYVSDSMNDPSIDILQSSLTVNVIAPVALNKIIIPLMPQGSSIIYIGSTLSEQATKNAVSYVTSKHAIIGLMRATAQDLADKGIRSLCIAPGFVETDMVKVSLDFIKRKVLAKRIAQPEEIASVIHFAAISPVLNNTVIHANLGQVMD